MKAIRASVLLAAVCLVAAGCGSGKKIGSIKIVAAPVAPIARSITITGATPTTIPHVPTGTRVSCKGWHGPGAKVPPRGGRVVATETKATMTPSGTGPSSSMEIQLKHLQNGSIRVTCKR